MLCIAIVRRLNNHPCPIPSFGLYLFARSNLGYKLLPFYSANYFPLVFSSSLSSHYDRPKHLPVLFRAALQHRPL